MPKVLELEAAVDGMVKLIFNLSNSRLLDPNGIKMPELFVEFYTPIFETSLKVGNIP